MKQKYNHKDVPNPGSDEALDLGCMCPVIDNGHGRGSMYGKDVFIFTIGCPVHTWEEEDEEISS